MAGSPDNTDKGALAPPINDPQFNPPQAFDFDGAGIRVIAIDGDPWFVARDVAVLLRYLRSYIEDDVEVPKPLHLMTAKLAAEAALGFQFARRDQVFGPFLHLTDE